MMTYQLVVMSGNFDKIKEISVIFESMGLPVVSIHDVMSPVPDILEDGDTFISNALKKVIPLPLVEGRIYLADDSGLSVDGLGGRPGVFSARYGGPGLTSTQQCQRLLSELGTSTQRSAHYTCAIALKFPDGQMMTTEGHMHGQIGFKLVGDYGFGYDPIFIPNGETRTAAQMLPEEKHLMSHRFYALKAAKKVLEAHPV